MIVHVEEIDNKRKERERDEQFRKEVLSAIQNSSRSQPRYVAQDPFKPFDNSGNFIPVDTHIHSTFYKSWCIFL